MKTFYQLGYDAGVAWIVMSPHERQSIRSRVEELHAMDAGKSYCDGFEDGARAQQNAETLRSLQS